MLEQIHWCFYLFHGYYNMEYLQNVSPVWFHRTMGLLLCRPTPGLDYKINATNILKGYIIQTLKENEAANKLAIFKYLETKQCVFNITCLCLLKL